MSQEHYKVLKDRMAPLAARIADHREQVVKEGRAKDVERRVLWDWYHAARIHEVYTYQQWNYLDSHIETALRAIAKDLTP